MARVPRRAQSPPCAWPPSRSLSLLGLGFAPRDSVPVPRDTAWLTPGLHPSSGVGLRPAPHLPAPELSPWGCPYLLGSVSWHGGVVRAFLAPCGGQSGAMRSLFVLSLVMRVGIQSRTGASLTGMMGTRAGRADLPRRSPHLFLFPRGALGPPRVPTLAAVASWQVTQDWAPGPGTAPPEPM